MKKILIVSIVSLIFIGCASIKQIPNMGEDKKHIYKKNYEIAKPRFAYVGEEIVKVQDYYITKKKLNKLKAMNDFKLDVGFSEYFGMKDDTYPIVGITDIDNVEHYVVSFPGSLQILRFCITRDGYFSERIIGQMNQILVGSPKVNPKDTKFEIVITENIDASQGYTNYEIVFTGASNNQINLLYREYTSDNMAKQAFYQNLSYPLDAKSIRFKNIVMSVENVSHEKIQYTVTQDNIK
jgi:hypothetical protein